MNGYFQMHAWFDHLFNRSVFLFFLIKEFYIPGREFLCPTKIQVSLHSDQSLCCLHEETLHFWPSKMCPDKF